MARNFCGSGADFLEGWTELECGVGGGAAIKPRPFRSKLPVEPVVVRSGAGGLRLRGKLASRAFHFAQDDIRFKAVLVNITTLLDRGVGRS
jgi:hypothetical protein